MSKQSKMSNPFKKIVLFLPLLLLLLVVTTACSNNGDTSDGDSDQETAENDKLAEIKKAGKLVLGTSPDFPPFEFYVLNDSNQKEIVGSDISLAQAIADEIGVDLEIKATDFNGVLANIQTGSVDLGISGFAKTEARADVMDFSEGYQQEVSDGYQGIIVPKAAVDKYKTLDDLKNAEITIGAQGGSIQYEIAQKLTSETNIKQYGTTDAAIMALDSGDIDAVTVSTSSASQVISSFPDLTILPKDGFDLDSDNVYGTNVVGFPKDDNNKSFIDLVNKVIQDNKGNGNIEKWKDEAKAQSTEAIDAE